MSKNGPEKWGSQTGSPKRVKTRSVGFYSGFETGVVGLLPLGSRLFEQDIEVPESLVHTSVALPLASTDCATPT